MVCTILQTFEEDNDYFELSEKEKKGDQAGRHNNVRNNTHEGTVCSHMSAPIYC